MNKMSERFQYLKTDINYVSNENNKRKNYKKQEWQEFDPQPVKDFQDKPLEFLQKHFSRNQIKIFDCINTYYEKPTDFNPSQEFIAQQVGVTRAYVAQTIALFKSIGLMGSNYRHLRKSHMKVSSYFQNPQVRAKLSCILKSLKALSLLALISVQLNAFYNNNNLQSAIITEQNKQGNIRFKEFNNKRRSRSLKESIMGLMRKDYDDNPISPTIRSLKELRLTKWGQIKLSCFPEDALVATYDQYLRSKNSIRDPFNWFFKMCSTYCYVHNLPRDTQRIMQLSQHYNMPEDAPMTLPQGIMSITELVITKERPLNLAKPEPVPRPSTGGRPEAYTPWKPPLRPVIDKQQEFTKFEELKKSTQFLDLQKKLGIIIPNPFREDLKDSSKGTV